MLMKKFLVRSLLALVLGISPALANAAIITQWDFNFGNDGNTGTGTTNPSIGVGTIGVFGGVTSSFASGDASGGSSDPNVGDDSALQTTTYPAPTGPDESAGIQVNVSTVGQQNIIVSFDQRHSNSSSRYIAFLYTINGVTYNRLSLTAANSTPGITPPGGTPPNTPGLYGTTGTFNAGIAVSPGDDWFNGRSVNLTGIPGVDNNPLFGFQVVASKDGQATYTGTNNPYASTGTLRFDMVTVSGTVIPEPSTFVLAGFGIAAVVGYGLRRRMK
jgi:hypothetical protein